MEPLAQEWLDGVVARGREAWDKITPNQKRVVTETLADIAKLRALEVTGTDISGELPIAEAILRNMAVIAGIITARTVMDVIGDSLKQAGSLLLGLLGKIKL